MGKTGLEKNGFGKKTGLEKLVWKKKVLEKKKKKT